jgi:hypothetical protein
LYGSSGTGKWDIYGNGANLRISDNESAGILAVDTGATFGGNVALNQYLEISSTTAQYAYMNFGASAGYGWQLGKAPATGGVVDDQGFYLYNLNTGYQGVNLAVLKSGNVGIGVTGPVANLQVEAAGSPTIAMSSSGLITSGTRGDLAWYNSSVSTVANIRADTDTSGTPDNVGTDLTFFTRAIGGSLTQKMVIKGGGSVGINVANPGFQAVDTYGQIGIEIKGGKENNQAPCIRLHETGSGKGSFELRSTRNTLTSGNYFAIAEGTNTFFTIRGDDDGGGTSTRGNVGIGTISPEAKLHIKGSGTYNHTPANPQGADFLITSSEMSDNNYHSIMQLVSVRQSLSTGNGANGYLGFSTIDDSNNAGINDAARIAIVNEANAVTSPTALSFWTNTGAGGSTGAATERMRIESSGTVIIGGGGNNTSSSNNFIPVKINTPYSTTASPQWSLQGWVATTDGADPFAMTSGETTKNVYMGIIGAAYMNQNRFSIIQGGAERLTINLTQTGGGGSQGFIGIGTSLPTQKLDVAGIVKHQGLDMTAGIQVDQTTSISVSLNGPAGSWNETGIDGTDIGNNGSYVIQVYSNTQGAGASNYSMYWTGTMSWYAFGTNSSNTSEIYLNSAGHYRGMDLELRTISSGNGNVPPSMRINFKSNQTLSGHAVVFKFRRLM